MKIIKLIAKYLKERLMSSIFLWLLVIGLALFITTWILSGLFVRQEWPIQLAASLAVELIYILIILIFIFVRNLIYKKIMKSVIKKARGKVTLKYQDKFKLTRAKYRTYIYFKLNLTRLLPLFIQRLWQRKNIYVWIGDLTIIQPYLITQGWQALDNPRHIATQVFADKENIIIATNYDNEFNSWLLKILTRYSRLRPVAGYSFVIDTESFATTADINAQKDEIKHALQALHTTRHGRKLKLEYLLGNLQAIPGSTELSNLADITHYALNASSDHIVRTLAHLIANHMVHNNDGNENARLQLFLLTLDKVVKQINELTIAQPSQLKLLLTLPQWLTANIALLQPKYLSSVRRYGPSLLKGASVLVALGALTLLTGSYIGNSRQLALLQQYVTQTKADETTTDQKSNVVAENYLLSQIFNPTVNCWWFHFGLYQGYMMSQMIWPIYKTQLQQNYLPALQQALQQLLLHEISKKQNTFIGLTAYLMLNQTHHYDGEFIWNWLQQNKHIIRNQQLLSQHNHALLLELPTSRLKPLALNTTVVSAAKKYLPALDMHLNNLLTNMAKLAGDYNFNGAINDEIISAKNHLPTISNLYTKPGYQQFIQTSNIQKLIRKNWIYQKYFTPQKIRIQLFTQYTKQYITAWRNFLTRMQVAPSTNFTQALTLAAAASRTQSFWQAWFTIIHNNLTLDGGNSINRRVNKYFYQWTQYHAGSKLSSQLNAYFTKIDKFMQNLAKADKTGSDVLTALKNMEGRDKNYDLWSKLNELSAKMPKDAVQLLLSIRKSLLTGMMNTAGQTIHSSWLVKVVPQLTSLMQQYPFTTTASTAVNLNQFTTLLKSGSIVDKFLLSSVDPFMDAASGRKKPLFKVSMSFIGTDQRDFIILANIRDNFFNNQNATLQVSFALQPIFLSNWMVSTRINMLNQNLLYQHGPSLRTAFHWPTELVDLSASLVWQGRTGKQWTKSLDGQWAWLKLLHHGTIAQTAHHDIWKISFSERSNRFQLNIIASPALNMLLNHQLTQLGRDLLQENDYGE